MDNELAQIDIIRRRFKVSYEEARDALNAASGDIVGALATLEKRLPQLDKPDMLALCAETADEVNKLVSGGPIRSLRIKYGNKLLKETPVALTAVAAVAVAVIAVLVSKLVIEVEKGEEGTAK